MNYVNTREYYVYQLLLLKIEWLFHAKFVIQNIRGEIPRKCSIGVLQVMMISIPIKRAYE